jgi:chorismate mutase/prephenate dehydratase
MDEPLQRLRDQIDALDAQLLDLLNRRARLAQQVGALKEETGAPIYRPEREAEVLRKVTARNRGPLPDESVAGVMREVMSACRALERPLRVAYLGPAGTYSEQAALAQFGSAVELQPCVSIDEVFRALAAGSVAFAVVPIENSTEGSITRTLDLLLSSPRTIVAELSLAIHHNLLSRSGTMAGVTRVCAHAQALGQCVNWLNQNHPGLERQPVSSNAQAAQIAADDPSAAAIAGDSAAARYGLTAVATHIQDDPGNRTRFVVLGEQQTQPSGRDKTSLVLAVPNVAGAVHHMLEPLARHGVSMTRFESRPARTGAWEYLFYVDVEGHARDSKVAVALEELRRQCAFFRNLGSYPAAI